MKTMRLPLLIALGVAIIGVICGSFFDLQISSAIASPTNAFALTVSAICPTFGFMPVAMMGGGFIALILKGKHPVPLKVLFCVLALGSIGVSIYYPGGEYFGVNGFKDAAPGWVGYLIVLIPEGLACFFGYYLFKDIKNDRIWILYVIVIVMLIIALLGIITVVKNTMHRPRYRLISNTELVGFHNWWERCAAYSDLKDLFPHDDFKSFPSGHTAETSIFLVGMTFFPLIDKKYSKFQLPLFIAGCCLVLFVAFARILAAAHFLSDVSMGATIMIGLLTITNEIVIRIKPLHPEEVKE